MDIGSSQVCAEKSLLAILRRLQGCSFQKQEYIEFLRAYECALGHMRRVQDCATSRDPIVYIPHHPIFRSHSTTASMHVVFNASSFTSNGTSLNDHILTGPKFQSELPSVILRWRTFRFVYCADIEKIYHQILVDEHDLNLQRILWSETQHDKPHEYQLLTVTYGMACAPFLAFFLASSSTIAIR